MEQGTRRVAGSANTGIWWPQQALKSDTKGRNCGRLLYKVGSKPSGQQEKEADERRCRGNASRKEQGHMYMPSDGYRDATEPQRT